MEKKKLEIISFLISCSAILFLTFFVFKPFFTILAVSAVLALLLRPLYKKLVGWYGKGKNFFAFVIVLLSLVFLILPIIFFGIKILGQVESYFASIQSGQGQGIQNIEHIVESFVRPIFPTFTFDVTSYASNILTFVTNNFGSFITQTSYIFFQTFLVLMTLFFFLRDGEELFSSITSLSPFSKKQTKEMIESVHKTVTSVVHGTLFVGLIRWFIFSLGFYLFGIPNPMVLGTIAGIIGIIPGLGTPFVIVPALIILLLTGNIIAATGIGLIGILTLVFVDNMLSSYYFGKGLEASPIFILFSILGGVMFFGPLGFIFGPIILSLCISIIEMYKILILKPKKKVSE